MVDDARTLTGTEQPPESRYELAWASPEEKAEILGQMRSLHRQTMNLRTMPTARLMLLKTQRGDVVGWGGVDVEHDPQRPELFSLHVMEEFRTYTLGLVLELARYTWVRKHGHKVAYARMDAAGNFSLLRYRLEKQLYRMLRPDTVDRDWAKMCTGCELFGTECREQAFFEIDVEHFIEHGERRIGAVDVENLPRPFELRREHVRSAVRPLHPELPTGARPYKPYWI